MARILIIEDDPAIGLGIQTALRAAEHDSTLVADGREGYTLARAGAFDMLLLDLMLPSMSGEDICREVRAHKHTLPILMLTSKHLEADRVHGLDLGADDYLTKPFSIQELLARIRALLRRTRQHVDENGSIRVGELEIDRVKQFVQRDGTRIDLTAREYRILSYFLDHADMVVSRQMLLDEVWGYDAYPTTRTVDNYILSLRKKIERDPAHPVYIQTVHTEGYRFAMSSADPDIAAVPRDA
jgi:DNA-binding response OmpR family regulator